MHQENPRTSPTGSWTDPQCAQQLVFVNPIIATCTSPIKDRYRSADFVGNRRVVFNIGGNHYRLIVAVAYRTGWVYVKFVGTHAEYDKVDAADVEM